MTEAAVGAALSSPEEWAEATCVPQSGSGVLARRGQVVLLVADSSAAELAPLLDHATMVAANGGDGRQLVRGFALLLTNMPGDPPPFVAMSPVEAGLAVFASGDASAFVDGEEISGRDSLAWAEKLFRWPVHQIEGRVEKGAGATAPGPFYLRDGVVPAGGFSFEAVTRDDAAPQLSVPEAQQEKEAAPLDAAPPTPPPPPPSAAPPAPRAEPPPTPVARDDRLPAQPVEHRTEQPPVAEDAAAPVPPGEPEVGPAEFESVLLGPGAAPEADDVEPTPLPIISHRQDLPVSQVAVSQVRGVFCKNHHFNDPRMLFCAVCGINMVQQTPVLVDGARPPLGVIVLDDGSVFQLDISYLLGRDPDSDDLVRSGHYRGIQLSDTQNMISRIHARLELRNWDVVLADNASTNGTFVAAADSADWQRLPKNGEHSLTPGTRVRLGNRTLAFNTHRGS